MKIPTEAVPLARSTPDRADETRKTQPVRDASETGYELSHPAENGILTESDDKADQAQPRQRSDAANPRLANDNMGRERRKEERRRGDTPVLLDTRLRQIRRRKIEASKISLKI